jgi:hypothetical protein
MENRIQYPVDFNSVDMTSTTEEMEYDLEIEKNVLQGKVNPRFIRWHQEDNRNEIPIDDTKEMKIRYRTCKLCPMFNQETKICEENDKFMPIKVQFLNSTCPLEKW